jgi:anti-sigma B factor antagonist
VPAADGSKTVGPPGALSFRRMDATSVSIEQLDNATVVALPGEHDLASAPRVREVLSEAESHGGPIVVELTPTEFMDSSILGVLLGALRRAREEQRGFTFALDREDGSIVSRLFEVTGLFSLFPVYTTRADAVEAASRGVNQPMVADGP